MRILFTFMCVLALSVMGCETTSTDGDGGTAGDGGAGGSGGIGGDGGTGGVPECETPDDCDRDNGCTFACTDGTCVYTDEFGTQCSINSVPVGLCMQGVCLFEDCEGAEDGLRCFRFGASDGICADGSCKTPCDDDGQCPDDENVCTHDGTCNTDNGACDYPPVEDGTLCPSGLCIGGVCDREF